MTAISRDTVLKLAILSSIQLADEEIDDLCNDLERILAYVEQLNELDTDGVEPAYQVTGLQNVMRPDTVVMGDVSPKQLLTLAPERVKSQIKVPKVL